MRLLGRKRRIGSRANRADAGRGPLRHQHARHGRAQSLGEIKQRFPDLPVVMVTAYGDDERRRQAAEYGAANFLAKPVEFEHLKAQLRQLPGVPD
jgi:DNA-binding NtrC family response regulator